VSLSMVEVISVVRGSEKSLRSGQQREGDFPQPLRVGRVEGVGRDAREVRTAPSDLERFVVVLQVATTDALQQR
jgi:hypothetical protein